MEWYFYLSELDESLRPANGGADEGEVDVAVAAVATGTLPSFLAVTSLMDERVFCSQLLRDCDCISVEIVVNWCVRS